MKILDKLLGSKATVTSTAIRVEIERAENEATALRTKLETAESEISMLDDAAHIKVIESNAATKRAIARLDARVSHLTNELPAVVAAEEAALKTAADKALKDRVEACRKANAKEAAKLLAEYDLIGPKLGDILARLNEIAAETNSVNADLAHNPVAESITGYETLYRKHPDRQATERREMRHVWVHDNGRVEIAHLDQSGNPIKADRIWNHMKQGYEGVNLERRDVIVGQTHFRSGHYESPLSAIILPAGFAGGATHWPRR